MKIHSVKRRLTIVSVLLSFVVITLSAIWVYIGTRQAILQVNNEHFQEVNEKLLKLLLLTSPSNVCENCNVKEDKILSNAVTKTESLHNYSYLLLNSQGEVLAKTRNAPAVNVYKMLHLRESHIEDRIHNIMWRGMTMKLTEPNSNQSLWLWFGEDMQLRSEVEAKIAFPAIIPLVTAIPLLCLLLVLSTNYLFAPINRLEKEVARKSITNLSPLNMTQVPSELTSFVRRLNFLFREVDAAWQREKRFNQEAAHELRTPLAVIMLNAQNALSSESLEEQKHHLVQIEKSIKRSERTIEQLLTLAKVDNEALVELEDCVDVASLLREVVGELVPLALKQEQMIRLEAQDKAYNLQGNEIFLGCLFRNIIDNAIRYSGIGTDIVVEVQEDAAHILVSIGDNGRGMAQEEIDRIFERFFRGSKTQNKAHGVGLGMAIVQRVVELHDGQISIHSAQGESLSFVIKIPKRRAS